jgi:hypothetical protein
MGERAASTPPKLGLETSGHPVKHPKHPVRESIATFAPDVRSNIQSESQLRRSLRESIGGPYRHTPRTQLDGKTRRLFSIGSDDHT